MEPGKRIHRDEATWREIFARQAGSGLRVSQFCRQEKINPGVFRRWRTVLEGGSEMPRGVRQIRQAVSKSAPFVELGALPTNSRCEIRVELGGGVILSIVRG